MELENETANNSGEELPLKRGIEQVVEAVQGSKDGAKCEAIAAAPLFDGAAQGGSLTAGDSSDGGGEGFEVGPPSSRTDRNPPSSNALYRICSLPLFRTASVSRCGCRMLDY